MCRSPFWPPSLVRLASVPYQLGRVQPLSGYQLNSVATPASISACCGTLLPIPTLPDDLKWLLGRDPGTNRRKALSLLGTVLPIYRLCREAGASPLDLAPRVWVEVAWNISCGCLSPRSHNFAVPPCSGHQGGGSNRFVSAGESTSNLAESAVPRASSFTRDKKWPRRP